MLNSRIKHCVTLKSLWFYFARFGLLVLILVALSGCKRLTYPNYTWLDFAGADFVNTEITEERKPARIKVLSNGEKHHNSI